MKPEAYFWAFDFGENHKIQVLWRQGYLPVMFTTESQELGHGRDSIIFWVKEWNIWTMNIQMCQSTEKELRVSFPFTVMCCAMAVQNQKVWEHICYFVFLHLIRQEVPLFQWENGTETATLKIQCVWNTRLITDVLENDKPLGLN